jgi:transcriptional regulator with XRE-family HTH domain
MRRLMMGMTQEKLAGRVGIPVVGLDAACFRVAVTCSPAR